MGEFHSGDYWIERYQKGLNSGTGSYGRLADYKAEYINDLVKRRGIGSVIEFGSGDGNQASLLEIDRYTGLDISRLVIEDCRSKFEARQNWTFDVLEMEKNYDRHDMAMSLDVIFHLVEDGVFERYMRMLFAHAKRYVLIYASDFDDRPAEHVRHRHYGDWVNTNMKNWHIVEEPEHPYPPSADEDWRVTSPAFFRLYQRQTGLFERVFQAARDLVTPWRGKATA